MAKATKPKSTASAKQKAVQGKIGKINRQALLEAFKAGKAGKSLPPSSQIYKAAAKEIFK